MDIDDNEIRLAVTTDQLNDLLTKMFVACNIPFRAVENEHFINFVDALQNAEKYYKPPCRQTLSTSCLTRVHDKIVEERKRLLNNTSSVILVDGWKNKSNNKKYLVFSLTNLEIPHTFLTFKDHTLESEDGESLANAITEAVQFSKETYNTHVFGIVTDNDSKIVCGARLAESSEEINLWQSTCHSHSGNLFLKSLVDSSFAETVRAVVSVYREPKLQTLLVNQGGTKLQNYPDTRFCYFRNTCESISKNLHLMRRIAMAGDVNIDNNVFETIFDDNFESKLLETIELMNSVCVLINTCQRQRSTAADAVEMWISLRNSNKFNRKLIDLRISKAIKPVAYAANVLHPKYQGLSLNEQEWTEAFTFFENNLDPETLIELDRFLNNKEKAVKNFIGKEQNPISFWRLIDHYYPLLHKAALKILMIPASTAPLESLFSNWAFVHNVSRNRLCDGKSAVLVDTYYSLRHFSFDSNTAENFVEDYDEHINDL